MFDYWKTGQPEKKTSENKLTSDCIVYSECLARLSIIYSIVYSIWQVLILFY